MQYLPNRKLSNRFSQLLALAHWQNYHTNMKNIINGKENLMGFVLPFYLALSNRECKGIIYYNPFRIRQMLHVLCNYNTFGKLFLPTHMLGKSSNCAGETFLHKANFLVERNFELDQGFQDLQALLSPWGQILPHNRTHVSASLGSRTICAVLYVCRNSSCTGSFHTPDPNTDAVQPRQALMHVPTMALSECECQMCWHN